ncbi:MlaD family protein [Flavobacterium beibuense]|uniref:ABC-type transport system involved in resistance to organic solvent, periplasmic component n=1 Tax=Flavobacterium beibuense TaxID=657326 RepID=A0A444W9F1_9FLAO|nr:MlaD family protein [Flavobacterium beibuense]RYJ42510.1 ABC-type transport system involved in resistance to organic solvent, periplasmic component [Flavobacterium beibuense]
MKVTREVKTAILVIGAILVFIWGYMFLRGKDLFNSYKTFYVVYDNVEGLSHSAPVTINGLVIGQVTDISFVDMQSGKLRVEMQVDTDFPISKTSLATLYSPDLLGGKQIEIIPDMKNPVAAENGEVLTAGSKPGTVDMVAQQLAPLKNKVESTVVSADSLLRSINNVMDMKTQENLRQAIADMKETMGQFNQASRSLNGILASNKSKIDGTLTNLETASGNFAQISDSLNKVNLAETVRKLENSLASVDQILGDVQQGKGTLGKLMKDEAMYNNLTDASNELKELLADFKNNPKRYVHFSVFGKKGTPYVEEKK